MKNRILSISRNTIPYVKQLRPIAGSVTASILMQQLDYWFARHPSGFYKFLEPCGHSLYKEGDSWTEELGFSKDEFRTAFAQIGTQHKSKSAFYKSEDPFAGKYYCSYFDRVKGMVYYLRNHELLDRALDALIEGSNLDIPCKSAIPISRNRQGQFLEIGNPDLQENGNPDLHISEITFRDYLNGNVNININNKHQQVCGRYTTTSEKEQDGGEMFDVEAGSPAQPEVKPTAIRVQNQKPKQPDKPIEFGVNDLGWVQMPKTKQYKLARWITTRRVEYQLATLFSDVNLDKDEKGNLRVKGNQTAFKVGEKVEWENALFGENGRLAMAKIRNQAHNYRLITQETFNDFLEAVFLDTVEWLGKQGAKAQPLLTQRSPVFYFFEGDRVRLQQLRSSQ